MTDSSIYINNGIVYLKPDDNNLYTTDIIQQVNSAMIQGYWVNEFPAYFELQEVGTYNIFEFVNGPNYSNDTKINYTTPSQPQPYHYGNKSNPNSTKAETNTTDIFIGLLIVLTGISYYVIKKNK